MPKTRQLHLPKLSREQTQRLIDCVRRSYQHRHYLKSFYGLAPLVEEYLCGDSNIHLHATLRVDFNTSDLCAVLERHPLLDFDVPNPGGLRHIRATVQGDGSGRDTSTHHRGNLYEAMFVSVVQLVEKPKGAKPLPIPSVVWLQPLKNCPVLAFEKASGALSPALFPASSPTTLALALWTEEEDGKTHVLDHTAIARIVEQRQLARKQIEGGAQVVSDFPDDGRPFDGQILLLSPQSKHPIGGVTVTLSYNNTIGITVKRRGNGFIERLDLIPCPSELGDAAIDALRLWGALAI